MQFFAFASTFPAVYDTTRDETLAEKWHNPSTPTANSHLVPNAHLLPPVYLMAHPLVYLLRIVPRFAKYPILLWWTGLNVWYPTYQTTGNLTQWHHLTSTEVKPDQQIGADCDQTIHTLSACRELPYCNNTHTVKLSFLESMYLGHTPEPGIH